MLTKPPSITNDDFKSAKWDEICTGRNFTASDVPTITLLCNWYAVVERCMEDISTQDGVQVAYSNEMGDIKALPQLSTMKQASAEIRALNKQLGINDEAQPQEQFKRKEPILHVIQKNRQSKATNQSRTKAV